MSRQLRAAGAARPGALRARASSSVPVLQVCIKRQALAGWQRGILYPSHQQWRTCTLLAEPAAVGRHSNSTARYVSAARPSTAPPYLPATPPSPHTPHPQEEKAKRAARAAKFGLQQPDALVYAPDPEELKKAERGAKFGTGYQPDGALMDMGARPGAGGPGGRQRLGVGHGWWRKRPRGCLAWPEHHWCPRYGVQSWANALQL